MATTIDWNKAKQVYVKDPTLTLENIAEKYRVSIQAVKKHAASEQWSKSRQNVAEKTTTRTEDKIADQLAEINIRHTDTFKSLQSLLLNNLNILITDIERRKETARVTGKPLTREDIYSSQSVKFFSEALRSAIEGERITLGLPINVTKSEMEMKMVDEFSKYTDEELERIVNDNFDEEAPSEDGDSSTEE